MLKNFFFYILGESYLHAVTDEDIEFGYSICKEQTRSGIAEFDEYASDIYERLGWLDATNVASAFDQFIILLDISINGHN